MRTVRYMWQIYNFFANFAVKQHHHMDSTPSKSYSHGELSRLINAALLRDDTPAPGKIANKIYNDIMMGSGAFARVSRMIETEAMHLISRDLPPSLLGSPSSQTNITEALHPDIRTRIETEFKQYLNSETVRSEVGTIYNELCDSIERAGWSFGIVNLARALEILRDKIRKQANVYNSSIALVGPYTDLGPLYEAACCKTNVHGNHYVDIQDFYTALCDNTRTGCTEIASTFYRDTLHDLAEWPRLQAIIESNVTLHERCRAIADQNAGKPKCRVFSDPDRSSPMDLVDI